MLYFATLSEPLPPFIQTLEEKIVAALNHEKKMTKKDSDHSTYKIIIKGRLDERWSDWFDGLEFTYGSDGTTTLSGPLPDQAALHSVLLKIRDMNLTLISVIQSESNPKK